MSEIVHSSYPDTPFYYAVAERLGYVAEVSSLALQGLRLAFGRKKEPITKADRENAEQVRAQTGRDYIRPRGTDTSLPDGDAGRRTPIDPNSVPDDEDY